MKSPRVERPAFAVPVYSAIYKRARPYLQTRHNEVHTKVSYGFALRLLTREDGDPTVVIPAILLHDVGWARVPEERQLEAFGPNVKEPELTRVHEREGAAMAERILHAVGYPEAKSREIVQIIAGHDTRLATLGPSDALVKDADKLFRLSRIGFLIDCERFGLLPASHLAWLEERVDSWFFTEAGKDWARTEISGRHLELAG